jgi:hypothetical protein
MANQNGASEALEHHEGVDAHVSRFYGGGDRQMVQLLGGSPQDPLGNLLLKKLKLATEKMWSAGVRAQLPLLLFLSS